MSCCYCCGGGMCEQIFRKCCPGLTGGPLLKRPGHYAKIEYTLVPDVRSRSTSNSFSYSRRRDTASQLDAYGMTRRYTLPQESSQHTAHPQIDVTAADGEAVVTEQPSSSKAFLQRFACIPAQQERTSTLENGGTAHPPVCDHEVGLPVYKERVLQSHQAVRRSPMVQFSLYYDLHQSKLRVHLQRISSLPGLHLNTTHTVRCDPMAVVHLEPDREDTFKSQVMKGTHAPEFNQSFHFERQSLEQIKQQTLVFRVFNHADNDKAIGKACLPLHDVELFGVIIQMKLNDPKDMESNFRGDLLVSLMYNPTTHEFNGIIHKATGLKKCDMFGLSDPFVKVVVTYNERRVHSWKSTVKKKTLCPVYNESFSYRVTQDVEVPLDINNITLHFYIIDHDRVGQNDKMGEVKVGQFVGSEQGRRHWTKLLQSPWQRICFWHSIEQPTQSPPSPRRFNRGRSPLH